MLTGLHLHQLITTHKGEKGTPALSNRVDPHNAVLYPSDSIKHPNLQRFVRGTTSQYQRELSSGEHGVFKGTPHPSTCCITKSVIPLSALWKRPVRHRKWMAATGWVMHSSSVCVSKCVCMMCQKCVLWITLYHFVGFPSHTCWDLCGRGPSHHGNVLDGFWSCFPSVEGLSCLHRSVMPSGLSSTFWQR